MRPSIKALIAGLSACSLGLGVAAIATSSGVSTAAVQHTARTAGMHFASGTAPNLPAPSPKGARPEAGNTVLDSYNWSGYAASSSTDQFFTKVASSWTVTAVTCTPEDRIVSLWVGLDGLSDGTVEQLGTSAQCFEDTPVYYSWYEMYPAGSIEVGSAVQPGDKITASVTRTGTSYVLALTDATTSGNNIHITSTCALTTCSDTSAEVIAERPAYSTGIVPLAQFSPVSFSASSVTGGGTTGSLSAFSASSVDMIDSTDTYFLNTTGALNPTGKAFSDSWVNSY
jgi:hypothetical protein